MTLADAEERLKEVGSLIRWTLLQAVTREVNMDLSAKKSPEQYERQRHRVRGLSIIYCLAFLQSHVNGSEWKAIKGGSNPAHSANRSRSSDFDGVNWEWFDTFKYIRDCFAHDSSGCLFPAGQPNTQRFLAILAAAQQPPGVVHATGNNVIELSDASVDACLDLVRTILRGADAGGNLV